MLRLLVQTEFNIKHSWHTAQLEKQLTERSFPNIPLGLLL